MMYTYATRLFFILWLLLPAGFVSAQDKKHTGEGEVSEIIIPTSATIRNNFNLFYEIHLSRANIPTPSFWYKIIFSKDCSFEFTLFPISEEDGYDFYFFRIASNADFCKALKEEKIISCNTARIYKTYHDTEQSEKFRASLVDIKPIEVKAGDAIYIEVFSIRGNDCGHILDFRTIENSFVVKVVNDNCNGNKSDSTVVGTYKPLVKDERQAMSVFSNVLCPLNKKPTYISSIQVNNKNVSVHKKLDYATYSASASLKYKKQKQDPVKMINTGPTQKDTLAHVPPVKLETVVPQTSMLADSSKVNVIVKSTADLNSLPDPAPIKYTVSTLQADKEKNATRLEVDHVLFSLLREDLKRKIKSTEEQLKNYSGSLKKVKDVERKEEMITAIKETKLQKAELQNKVKDTDKKLKQISKLLREEQTKPVKSGESVFAKSTKTTHGKSPAGNMEFKDEVVYKIQIGVYKNAVATDIFKGLAPLFEESFPGGVKYSAGAFRHFSDARHAKDYIKSMGLTDAFVVAYYNGERISIDRAKAYEKK